MKNSKFKTQSSKLRLKSQEPLVLRHSFAPYPLRFEFSEGFTLLETIVALAVILAAAVGPVSLITSGIADFAPSKNKLTANNLAQEGIELVRAVRENNLVCDILNGPTAWPWNEDPEAPDPPSGNQFTNITVGISVDRTLNLTCGGAPGISIVVPLLSASCASKLRFDPATGIYGYSGSQETFFSRCVQIKVPPDSPDGGIPAGDQMDVISTVEWTERSFTKSVTLRERLYNWK